MRTTKRHFLPLWIKVRSLLISKGKKRVLHHCFCGTCTCTSAWETLRGGRLQAYTPSSPLLSPSLWWWVAVASNSAHIRRGNVLKHVPDVSQWRLKVSLEENFPDEKITWLQSLNCDFYTFICTKRALCLGFNNIKWCSRGWGRASNRLAVALHVLITAIARWTVSVSDKNVWGNGQL